jgi:hypothetical protein
MPVFAAALLLTVLICLAEAVMLAVAGAGLGAGLGALGDAVDADGGTDGAADGDSTGAAGVMAVLNAGRLPLVVYAALASATFGISGIALQNLVVAVTGAPLPLLPAVAGALVAGLAAARGLSRPLGRLLPRTETSAVFRAELVGLAGTVTLGVARAGAPAQVRVRDGHGQRHYVMAEPGPDAAPLRAGTRVVLAAQLSASVFLARPADPLAAPLAAPGDPGAPGTLPHPSPHPSPLPEEAPRV